MRFLTTTYEEYLNIAKSNGYELYDTSIDTFESWNIYTNSYETKTITTYYFEYDENLFWLFVTNNYNYYNYDNPGGFTLSQIANLIRVNRPLINHIMDVISIDEELRTIKVLELKSPEKDIIDYLSNNGYSYDLKVEFVGSEGVENYKGYIYKVNYVNDKLDQLDQRSEKLIECLKSYEEKSVNGKISIPRSVKYSLINIEG